MSKENDFKFRILSRLLSRESQYTEIEINEVLIMIDDNTKKHGFTFSDIEYLKVMRDVIFVAKNIPLTLKETIEKSLP